MLQKMYRKDAIEKLGMLVQKHVRHVILVQTLVASSNSLRKVMLSLPNVKRKPIQGHVENLMDLLSFAANLVVFAKIQIDSIACQSSVFCQAFCLFYSDTSSLVLLTTKRM